MADNRDHTLARVQSGAIDGRMRTLRFRQAQFQNLYQYITENRDGFIAAAQVDNECNKREAEIEFASALIELRNHYDALDLTTDLEQEYRLAKGQSSEARMIAIGIVYLVPDTNCMFFGVLSALCAAIEAGSCCVLELEQTMRKTPGLLRQMFSESLDQDAFGVVSSRAPSDYLSQCVVVDQAQKLKTADVSAPRRLLTSPTTQNVAIVDRTADVELAARELVASRLAFNACSRNAVDLVLVNEFVADSLVEAVVQASQKFLEVHADAKPSRPTRFLRSSGDASESTVVDEEVKLGRAKVVHGDSGIRVVEILERLSTIISTKVSSRNFIVVRYTSLDDPIDLLNKGNNQPCVGMLYLFAGPREAKYMSQYIFSQLTAVNHIPAHLMVGPTAPVGYPVSLRTRYSASMFQYPSPQIAIGPRSHQVSKILAGPAKSAWLLKIAQKPLKPSGQPPAGAWGFFEQGMVIGALVYLLPIVGASLFGAGYAGVWGYRKMFHS